MPESDAAAHQIARPPVPLVLVIDDRADARERWLGILATAGYEAQIARTGFEGIVKAASCLPRAILIRTALPGLDGAETTRLLKGCLSTRGVPVIACSDDPAAIDLHDPETPAFAAVVASTCQAECLLHALEQALGPVRDPVLA